MASGDSKVEKIQLQFQALSSVAASLNAASDELTKTVSLLDESLIKLNIGLTVWVTFRYRYVDENYPLRFDIEQIGFCKVNNAWGISLRHIWGDESVDWEEQDGPWLFNDAPRDMRLHCVDKIPDLIEALFTEASATTKRIQEKTLEVRELASVIGKIANPASTSGKGTTVRQHASSDISPKESARGPLKPQTNEGDK